MTILEPTTTLHKRTGHNGGDVRRQEAKTPYQKPLCYGAQGVYRCPYTRRWRYGHPEGSTPYKPERH